MGLQYISSLEQIVREHDALSLDQGRDLFVIDPRGAGLSKPLLNCTTFVDNVLINLNKQLTLEEEYKLVEDDYRNCVKKFKKESVNFNGYNSIAIADDVESLREAVGIDKWVLFGVSYSTTYAMFVAKKYPEHVESMVLDSACFPNFKRDHNYLVQSMDRYNALYNYKEKLALIDNNRTKSPVLNVKQRLWGLHKKFNKEPILVDVFDLKLNGNYMINSILWGAYGTKIFKDLPKIISEMEKGKMETFLPYFENYLYFLLDRTYGDVSTMAHYCYEDKPFIDFEFIKKQNSLLPEGYIRESAILTEKANDFCKEMNISSRDKTLADVIKTDIPTLFIHGEYDSVTPLRDVLAQMKNFKDSKLSIYKKSHSVMSEEDGIEEDVALFVDEVNRDRH